MARWAIFLTKDHSERMACRLDHLPHDIPPACTDAATRLFASLIGPRERWVRVVEFDVEDQEKVDDLVESLVPEIGDGGVRRYGVPTYRDYTEDLIKELNLVIPGVGRA